MKVLLCAPVVQALRLLKVEAPALNASGLGNFQVGTNYKFDLSRLVCKNKLLDPPNVNYSYECMKHTQMLIDRLDLYGVHMVMVAS